jgi:hypothetical protein
MVYPCFLHVNRKTHDYSTIRTVFHNTEQQNIGFALYMPEKIKFIGGCAWADQKLTASLAMVPTMGRGFGKIRAQWSGEYLAARTPRDIVEQISFAIH